jgi:hypothetical protein
MVGSMIRLLAFVLPLGLDSFAVAAALGAARPAGAALVGGRFRERAEQVAAVALIVLGGYLIAQRALA